MKQLSKKKIVSDYIALPPATIDISSNKKPSFWSGLSVRQKDNAATVTSASAATPAPAPAAVQPVQTVEAYQSENKGQLKMPSVENTMMVEPILEPILKPIFEPTMPEPVTPALETPIQATNITQAEFEPVVIEQSVAVPMPKPIEIAPVVAQPPMPVVQPAPVVAQAAPVVIEPTPVVVEAPKPMVPSPLRQSTVSVQEVTETASMVTTDGNVSMIFRLDLRDPKSFFLAQNFQMEDQDIIYVANAKSVEFSKFLNILNLSSTTTNATDVAKDRF
jgi:hypothetical protein